MKRILLSCVLIIAAITLLFSCATYTHPEEFGFTEKESFPAHGEDVISIDLSSGGDYMVTSGMDRAVKVWDTRSGKLLGMRQDFTEVVASVDFGPNAGTLLTGDRNGIVEIYDLPSGELRHTLRGHVEQVYSVAFSPDGTYVLSGGKDEMVRLWDSATGEQLHIFRGHSKTVTDVAFGPKGKKGYSVSMDGTLRSWFLGDELVPGFLEKINKMGLLNVEVGPEGKRIAVSGVENLYDSTEKKWIKKHLVYIVDLQENRVKEVSTRDAHKHYVWALAWSPDGSTVVSGSNDREIYFWDLEDRFRKEKVHPRAGKIWDLAYSPNGDKIYLATSSGKIVVYSK